MANTQDRVGRWALVASAGFFSIYLGNVGLGKVSALMGASEPTRAGDVFEFLALFAATICFVIATLSKERQAKSVLAEPPPGDPRQTPQ